MGHSDFGRTPLHLLVGRLRGPDRFGYRGPPPSSLTLGSVEKRTRHVEKRTRHSVVVTEESARIGICSVCGPEVIIRRSGVLANGEDKWRCFAAHQAAKKISKDKASPEVKARRRAGTQRWYDANEEHLRRYRYSRSYGITPEDYDRILAEQGGVCGICGGPPSGPGSAKGRFHVDHSGDVVRGLLCGRCNTAIGLLKHDVTLMSQAIAWCS